MNKGELVKQVAERAQLDPVTARRAVDAMIDGISERLAAGEDVILTGFGKFSVVQRAEREGVNPREPGTRIRIPARRSPRFTPGTQLRGAVAAGPDGQTVLDPVSLMANQPTVTVPGPEREAEPQAPGVALIAGQSDGPGIPVPVEESKPKSGARSRKSAAKSSGAGSAKGSGDSAGKSSGSSAGKSSGASPSKGSGKSAGKASGKSSGASASKGTSRRSGSRRAKES